MHDTKKFGFIYKDGASLKNLSEPKEQIPLPLSFRFDREANGTLADRFSKKAA